MKNIIRKLVLTFVLAFLLNLIWENLHSFLYVHYMGGEITNLILLKAALFDASFITILAIPFIMIKGLNQKTCIAFIFALFFAIGLEMYALKTGRWAYNELMPIIPLINIGLTPTIQLGLLFFAVSKIMNFSE